MNHRNIYRKWKRKSKKHASQKLKIDEQWFWLLQEESKNKGQRELIKSSFHEIS